VVLRKPIDLTVNGAKTGNFPAFSPYMEIKGAWTVKFDPKWGGPASVEFPELVDWTAWLDDGIKYYSGKATYLKSFDLSLNGLGNNSPRVYLNLGELKNVAEVRLNGKNLGVLWVKPFRVEITGAVKSGRNDLEIDIVNLWPNRLIGDDLLPPAKRFTKTNVRKFTKAFPLIPSGLLGPVTVESATMPER
jgi:hypothetical protein